MDIPRYLSVTGKISVDSSLYFLKPFLKGKILRSGEWERGKFEFDYYFAFLTNFLKKKNFLLSGISFNSSRGSFFKKNLSKTDHPFKFCKIGLKNTLFIFGRKMVVCCLFCFVLFCFVVCCNFVRFWLTFFWKPFFLREKFCGQESEREVNSILTTILRFWPTSWRDTLFCLVASDSARREDHFQKNLSKTDLPFKFCKIGLKNVCLLLLFVVCCNFVRFWLTFFLIEAFVELRKMVSRENYTMHGLGIAQPLRYPDSADLPNLQRCNWPNF